MHVVIIIMICCFEVHSSLIAMRNWVNYFISFLIHSKFKKKKRFKQFRAAREVSAPKKKCSPIHSKPKKKNLLETKFFFKCIILIGLINKCGVVCAND